MTEDFSFVDWKLIKFAQVSSSWNISSKLVLKEIEFRQEIDR